MQRATRCIETPLGPYVLRAEPEGLVQLAPAADAAGTSRPQPAERRVRAHLDAAEAALCDYFAGERRDFDDLWLAPRGSAFLLRVWQALRAIPFGATLSYGDLARAIGRPGAARAVGLANARNPIALMVPCHRVIGADGSLTGYAGGIWRKQWLLAHEQAAEGRAQRGGKPSGAQRGVAERRSHEIAERRSEKRPGPQLAFL